MTLTNNSSKIQPSALVKIKNIGAVIVDPLGTVEFANQEALRLLSADMKALKDTNIRQLIAKQTPQLDTLFAASIDNPFAQDHLSFLLQDHSGSIGLSVKVYCHKDSTGKALGFSLFINPIHNTDDPLYDLTIREALYREALDLAGIGIWEMNIGANETFRSPLHDALFGYPEPLDHWGYESFISHVSEQDRARVDKAYTAAAEGGKQYDVNYRVEWPDGSTHWHWSRGRFFLNNDGSLDRVAGLVADITDEQITKETKELSLLCIDASLDGIIFVDAQKPDYPMVRANPAFYKITGYCESEIIGHNCRLLQGPDSQSDQLDQLRKALAEEKSCTVILRNYKKSGEPFWNQLWTSPVRNSEGIVTHYVGIQRDVTKEFDLQRDLVFRASHDELTGLFNRRKFKDELEHILDDTENDELTGIYYVDIDNFKQVNDLWGHQSGDHLLQEFARKMIDFCGSTGVCGRFGGDEFCLAIPKLKSIEEVTAIAESLKSKGAFGFSVRDHLVEVSVSIGVSVFPVDNREPEHLIRYADDALIRAKRNGKSTFTVFDEKERLARLAEIEFETELSRAITNQHLAVHYQAKFNSISGKLTGFESLIRWFWNGKKAIPPSQFIPVAERTGLIHDIGRWTIDTVLKQMSDWCKDGYELVPVAVNISSIQLESDNLSQFILARLNAHAIPGNLLEIELTETVGVYDSDKLTSFMNTLKPMGITFTIDDFGTGYSNLDYLRRFAFDCVKIDRQFVAGLLDTTEDAAICRSIVALAEIFNLRVIGEGVEDSKTADYLKKIGCFELQGFLFARPVPSNEAMAFMKSESKDAEGNPLFTERELHDELPEDEQDRLQAIKKFNLDTSFESGSIQSIVELARVTFTTQAAYFNIIYKDRSIQKAGSVADTKVEIDDISYERATTICSQTIRGTSIYTVPDLKQHPDHKTNTHVASSDDLRFYAGISIYSPDGKIVGSFCLVDKNPRLFSTRDEAQMHIYANLIEDWISQKSIADAIISHRHRNQRNYDIEMPELWRRANSHGQSIGILAIEIAEDESENIEKEYLANLVSEVIDYSYRNSNFNKGKRLTVYRLRNNGFRMTFIGIKQEDIKSFWNTILTEVIERSHDKKTIPKVVTQKMVFTQSPSGAASDLRLFLRQL